MASQTFVAQHSHFDSIEQISLTRRKAGGASDGDGCGSADGRFGFGR